MTRVWTVISAVMCHAHSSLHISGSKPFVRSWKNQRLVRLGHPTGTPGLTELENLLKVYFGGLDCSLDPLGGLHLRLYSVRLPLVPCIDMTMSQARTHLKLKLFLISYLGYWPLQNGNDSDRDSHDNWQQDFRIIGHPHRQRDVTVLPVCHSPSVCLSSNERTWMETSGRMCIDETQAEQNSWICQCPQEENYIGWTCSRQLCIALIHLLGGHELCLKWLLTGTHLVNRVLFRIHPRSPTVFWLGLKDGKAHSQTCNGGRQWHSYWSEDMFIRVIDRPADESHLKTHMAVRNKDPRTERKSSLLLDMNAVNMLESQTRGKKWTFPPKEKSWYEIQCMLTHRKRHVDLEFVT